MYNSCNKCGRKHESLRCLSKSYSYFPLLLFIDNSKTPFQVVIKKCFELSGKQPLVDGIAFLPSFVDELF